MRNKIYAEMLKEQLIASGFTRVRISMASEVPTVSCYTPGPHPKLIRALVPGIAAHWRLEDEGWYQVRCVEPTR